MMTRSAGQGASSAPHGAPCSLPYASSHAGPRQDRSRTPSPQGKLRHGATPPSPLKFVADTSPPAESCRLRHLLVRPGHSPLLRRHARARRRPASASSSASSASSTTPAASSGEAPLLPTVSSSPYRPSSSVLFRPIGPGQREQEFHLSISAMKASFAISSVRPLHTQRTHMVMISSHTLAKLAPPCIPHAYPCSHASPMASCNPCHQSNRGEHELDLGQPRTRSGPQALFSHTRRRIVAAATTAV